MKKIVLILLLGLAVFLGACSSVSTKHLIGKPVQEDLSEKLDGIWDLGDENIGYVNYVGNGQLRVAGGEWKENRFDLGEMTIVLTKSGNRLFVNFQDTEPVEVNDFHYLFGYGAFVDEDYFLVWLPKVEAFEKAVSEGKIKGKASKEKYSRSVSLEDTPEKIDAFIAGSAAEQLFDLEKPMIYRRIKKIKFSHDLPATTVESGTTNCAKPPCE